MKPNAIFSLILFVLATVSTFAQDEYQWKKGCQDYPCIVTFPLIQVPGVSKEELILRLTNLLKSQLVKEVVCEFSEENLDNEKYDLCWTQSEGQKKSTRGWVQFSVARKNPNPQYQDYRFDFEFACFDGKISSGIYYHNQFNNAKFIKDRDGAEDPKNRKLYNRFVTQYNMVMPLIMAAINGKADGAEPATTTTPKEKKRLVKDN